MRKPRSEYPSELADKFLLRLPDGMRDRISDAAKANNRSMNAEIVSTLEEKYPPPIDRDEQQLLEFYREIKDIYGTGQEWFDSLIPQIILQEYMNMSDSPEDYGEAGSGKKDFREEIEKNIKKHKDLKAEQLK